MLYNNGSYTIYNSTYCKLHKTIPTYDGYKITGSGKGQEINSKKCM
jgi:hypothetical protein